MQNNTSFLCKPLIKMSETVLHGALKLLSTPVQLQWFCCVAYDSGRVKTSQRQAAVLCQNLYPLSNYECLFRKATFNLYYLMLL